MAMEGVVLRSSLATLLFLTLTLVVLAASAGGGGADAAAPVVEKKEKQCHRQLAAAGRPYGLVSFHNKDGEEIRLLADKGSSETLAPCGFANRSGHWFHRRRRHLPKPNKTPSLASRTDAEGFWNTLGALANATAASGDDPDPEAAADYDERYMLVGMQTSGGDKIRLVVVAGQRYFSITGFAKGWFLPPNWFFRDGVGERHRLLTSLGGGNGSSHAEVVASNVLAAMLKEGEACCG